MQKNRIAVGIDRGFGITKYFSKSKVGLIDSLVAPISEERAYELMKNNKDDKNVIITKINNEFFLVGSYVSKVEPSYAERDLRRSRDNLNETILFVTAMGLVTGKEKEAELIVTTGLPTEDFNKLKKYYMRKILNDRKPYRFTIYRANEKLEKIITVSRANIENQPKGTIITTINQKLTEGISWDELKNKRFSVGDIGFNTSDFSTYVGKDIVNSEKINFSSFAMVQIISTAKKAIEDAFNCKKSEDEILKAFKTGRIKVRGKTENCSEYTEKAFMKNAELLIREIINNWEQHIDSFDEMILTGGVLENRFFINVLKELIKEKCGWNITIPESPQYANAYGFYLISESILTNL